MSMPLNVLMDFPEDENGDLIVGTGIRQDIAQYRQCGYDFIRDASADFVANLEVSVCGLNWETLVSLAASGQDAIEDHYQFVRVNVSDAGTTGLADTTKLKVGGASV